MEHNFVTPTGFTPDLGLPAWLVCDPCGKRWMPDRKKPTGQCSGRSGGHAVSKIKNQITLETIKLETIKLDKRQVSTLSVVSVPRARDERDAFAIGNVVTGVWYAEHAYRAITPWGAMRFGSVTEAWAKLTELTGKRRPERHRKAETLAVPVRPSGQLYDTLRKVAMGTKEQ